VTHKILSMYIFLFLTLYMFRAHRAHHQERQIVSIQLVYIFTSYTTINIIIHTIKCYKFNGYMFRSPLRPSSGQLLQIVRLQCAYNMGSHNVYIYFIHMD